MNRIEWIDMAKGYGIICVIIGHITTPGITVWIYTFHIPLFFFLSGYLFHNNYTICETIRRKVHSLVVPYFCLGIPVLFHELVFHYGLSFSFEAFCQECGKLLIQNRYTPLWFIASLFIANVLLYFVCKYIRSIIKQLTIVFLLAVMIVCYWKMGGASMLWNIDISLFVMPFMLIAKKLNENRELVTDVLHRKMFFGGCLFGNIMFGGLNYYMMGRKTDLYFEDVDVVVITYLSALCGILWVLIVSHFKTIHSIAYIGRNSLLIFAWHLVVYNWLGRLYDFLGIFQTPLPLLMIFVRDMVSLVLILAVLIPINEMILHSRLKFILGR